MGKVILFQKLEKVQKSEPSKAMAAIGKSPTLSDIQRLGKRLETGTTERELRDRAILVLLAVIGMRASELLLLRKSDFKLHDGTHVVQYRRPKRRDVHTVKLSMETRSRIVSAIETYHEVAGLTSDHIFWSLPNHLRNNARTQLTTRSLQRIVNSWNIRAGNGKLIAPHAIRHLVGWTVSKQKDFIHAQKLLGHADPKTTSTYYTDPSVFAFLTEPTNPYPDQVP
ncbi:MAG: site-specific integrase [Spirochaetia bacterium]|nr:site-specific integrase [Spirochaetia bacterium]